MVENKSAAPASSDEASSTANRRQHAGTFATGNRERQRRHASEVVATLGHLTAKRAIKTPAPRRESRTATLLENSS